MRYEETVGKFYAVVAKEPELRKRYLAAMEPLQVTLPPAEERPPERKLEDLVLMARRIQEGMATLAAAGIDLRTKIGVRRELRAIEEEICTDLINLMEAFVADAVDMLHHLKKLAKIENNPNGYYTQKYRGLYAAYRESMKNLHGGKARGRARRKAKVKYR